jgi:hypothetical protein
VLARLLLSAQLYALPNSRKKPGPGRPPSTGKALGSPQTLARHRQGWRDPPSAADTQGHSWGGLWHSGLPGRPIRVVIVRRTASTQAHLPRQSKPRPVLAAFYTTALRRSLEAILQAYGDRWAVEIDRRDGQAV